MVFLYQPFLIFPFFAFLKETDTFKPIQILLFYLTIFKYIINELTLYLLKFSDSGSKTQKN